MVTTIIKQEKTTQHNINYETKKVKKEKGRTEKRRAKKKRKERKREKSILTSG